VLRKARCDAPLSVVFGVEPGSLASLARRPHHRCKPAIPNGKRRTTVKTEAFEFPNEDVMVVEIEDREIVELPLAAEGNPRYVPEGFEA
jgi:hypothetical protein